MMTQRVSKSYGSFRLDITTAAQLKSCREEKLMFEPSGTMLKSYFSRREVNFVRWPTAALASCRTAKPMDSVIDAVVAVL